MFIAALFIIARTWKPPRCPSADERIRKLWYIYTMDYYSAIKNNTFESVLMRWMKLEPIIQSEVSQKEKCQYNFLKRDRLGCLRRANSRHTDSPHRHIKRKGPYVGSYTCFTVFRGKNTHFSIIL